MTTFEWGRVALVNGKVFTADPERPWATAVGIRNGRVIYVGDDADDAVDAAGTGAEVIDLAGRLATPGLIDVHCHPTLYGGSLANIDLQNGVGAVEDILQRVRERAAQTPAGQWMTGWGYYNLRIAERRPPNRWELDAAAPDHPILLVHRSGHEAVTNSLGLKLAGYDRDTPDPVGGHLERDERGELTGVLVENAQRPLRQASQPEVTPEKLEADLRRAIDSFLSFGITSVGEANVTSALQFQVYQRVQQDASAPRPRFYLMMGHWENLEPAEQMGLMSGYGDEWLRVGPMKFFIDGTEGMRTAKVSQPFADQPDNTGMWMFDPDEFRERVMRAHLAGWQCATHAIGDAAIELTLDAYKAAQEALPRPDLRHRIEHASLLRPDLIERLAREEVIPVPGGRFASNDYPVLLQAFGEERVRWYQPWNSMIERNIPVPISSDAPVQSPDPAKNLWAIVNSRSEFEPDTVMQPEEVISLEETLLAYTRAGAFASREEHVKGMLRTGMYGDVTVFDRDLTETDPLALDEARVDLTVVDGVVAYRRG